MANEDRNTAAAAGTWDDSGAQRALEALNKEARSEFYQLVDIVEHFTDLPIEHITTFQWLKALSEKLSSALTTCADAVGEDEASLIDVAKAMSTALQAADALEYFICDQLETAGAAGKLRMPKPIVKRILINFLAEIQVSTDAAADMVDMHGNQLFGGGIVRYLEAAA